MKKISFICVNYHNFEYTKKFCQSLSAQNSLEVDFKISCMVVDNSSDIEDSSRLLAFCRDYAWVKYIKAVSNLGYFGGLNLGLASVRDDVCDYVVICNNDLEFDMNFCSHLCLNEYSKNIFAVCPDVVTADGIHQNPHSLRKISFLRRIQFDLYFSHYYLAQLMSKVLGLIRPVKSSPVQPSTGCETHLGIGAIYVLTPEFLKKFKKLNFPHFLYGEEAYFSEQIHSAGGILWFDPDLLVRHAESASLSKVPKRTAYEFARSGYPSYRKLL